MYEFHDFKTPEEDDAINRVDGCLAWIISILLAVCIAVCLCGCSTHRVVGSNTVIVKHDTLKVVNLQRDSIRLHDSIYVDRWMKGDTCFISKYVEHTAYKDRWRTDTVYKSSTDTLHSEQTIEVERKLTKWQRTQMILGDILLTLLSMGGIISAYFFYKRLR